MLLPILEYGDVFLSASTDVNKRRLQILQIKSLRCALNKGIEIRSHTKRLMKIKRPKTERFKKSLAYVGPKKWNDLPEQFHLTQHKDDYKTLVSKLVSQKVADFESGNG